MEETIVAAPAIVVNPTDQTKVRFSEAAWFEWLQKRDILLIGAGGIGSWVGLCLARIGCDLYVVDMDTVETHNLAGQMFTMADIGKSKVESLKDICSMMGGVINVSFSKEKYTEESFTNHIVVMAVDNMKTRNLAFNKWVDFVQSLPEEERKDCLFIDGRLLAEDYRAYAVTPDRIEEYRKTLFDVEDKEAEQILCTLKSTTHCAMGIAHDMVSMLSNFATNRAYSKEYGIKDARDLPFKVVKHIPLWRYEICNNETDDV